MGIVRTGLAAGMLALSFYAGMKYHEYKQPIAMIQEISIEERIKSLINDDRDQVMKALYKVGKEHGFEK